MMINNFLVILFLTAEFIYSTSYGHPSAEECERMCASLNSCFSSKYDERSDQCLFMSNQGYYVPYVASVPPQTEEPIIYVDEETTPIDFEDSSDPPVWPSNEMEDETEDDYRSIFSNTDLY